MSLENNECRWGLTKDEMLGNLFIYNVAGHDTTANTIGYAVYLMASDPRWQAWIHEELNFVFSGQVSVGQDRFEKLGMDFDAGHGVVDRSRLDIEQAGGGGADKDQLAGKEILS